MIWKKFGSYFRRGSLAVVTPSGKSHQFGDGSGPEVVIRLRDWRTALKIARNPELRFGEAYMDGGIEFLSGDLAGFFEIYLNNTVAEAPRAPGLFRRAGVWLGRHVRQANDRRQSRAHVSHHYDLSGALYRQFLDADMYYSCAYFERPDMTLDEAQQAKARHIVAKLLLKPGSRVLDIGSGWGGLARAIARAEDVTVRGLTLSTEQLAEARKRTADEGLADRVAFELQDYRDEQGRFDRVVSVGMFEHVGAPNFDAFFATVRDRLAPDGVALIHSIGRKGPPGDTNAWIDKYIFPGGYVPALSETLAAVERAGLWVTDIEILRLHYAETLRHWRERFHRNAQLVRQIYDDRFFRMWDFYLAVSEAGFRHGELMVFQIQLARQVTTVPVTRSYIGAAEQALAVTTG